VKHARFLPALNSLLSDHAVTEWALSGLSLVRIRAGRVVDATPEFRRAFGASPGRAWPESLALDVPDQALAWWSAGGAAPHVAAAQGGRRWLRLRAHWPAKAGAGEGMLNVEDVTAEHAGLERMRREGAHFHALIERSAEGISIFDVHANILYESPSNKRIHGYDAAEMVGRNLFDFCHPEDMARVMPRFRHLAEGPGVIETDIVRFRHKAGHYLYLEGVVLNATDDPRVGGLVNNFRDVTARIESDRELRRAKEAAEEAQRLQQHFLTNLSHEFKTPLTLIRGPLEELAAGRSGPEADTLALVRRNVDRLDALLTELIDLARLEAGAFALRAGRHDLVARMRTQLDWAAQAAGRKSIALRLDAPRECEVFFDGPKLDKIVGNLLGNAIKFSPAGSTVRVAVQEEPAAGRVRVAVCDEGPGMDETTRRRAFDRFFQGDAGLARGHEGMGVGLAIAREMVEMHGGTLEVASAPGAGSTFTFSLPLGCEHLDPDDIDNAEVPEPRLTVGPAPARPAPMDEPGEAGARPVLLLVEDNIDMRTYLRMQLDAHYRVVEAENGHAALQALERTVPAIILSDVMMPQLDGLELCRRLKAHPRWRSVPLLLLSAKGAVDHRVEGLKAGADDYLAKPFSMSELLQRLKLRLPAPAAPAEAGDGWAQKLETCVGENLGRSGFDVGQLARAMGYSSRQLQRRVLVHYEITPAALLLERRLARARELIAARRHETLAEVAHAVGLSPGYFSRRYRQTPAGRPGR